MHNLLEVLKDRFGLLSFRPGQESIIKAIMSGKPVVIVMPTGGGKSLCFQLPAVLLGGTTIVVSPLISLMKDQVDSLVKIGVKATMINSSLTWEETKSRIAAMKAGAYELIYIAPERFRNTNFVMSLAGVNIKLFVVDEAHAISHWGHDFRPDYRRLGDAIKICGKPQVVAATATATRKVRADIIEQLGMDNPKQFVYGFDRENLCLNVQQALSEYEKLEQLSEFLLEHRNQTGIIYTGTRKQAEFVQDRLKDSFENTLVYHAGLTDKQRTAAQNLFMNSDEQILVATNAFGMGIDKPSVRFVVHYQIPRSIEAYYQEIGRAGRDGMPADCLMLFYEPDIRLQKFFIDGGYPSVDMILDVVETIDFLQRKYIPADLAAISANTPGGLSTLTVENCINRLEKAGYLKKTVTKQLITVSMVESVPEEILGEEDKFRKNIKADELMERRASELDKLSDMVNFCNTAACLRLEVLKYFGETPAYDSCGACSNCANRILYEGYRSSSAQKSKKINYGNPNTSYSDIKELRRRYRGD